MVFMLAVVLAASAPAARAASAEEASEDYEKALEYFHNGELKAAFIETKNALQSDSRHLGARLLQGRIYLALGNGAAAEDAFDTARRFGAGDEASLTLLADAYIMQRKFEELYQIVVPGTRGQDLAAAGRCSSRVGWSRPTSNIRSRPALPRIYPKRWSVRRR
jgi:tetratricopeptide (TPR) repeat protein